MPNTATVTSIPQRPMILLVEDETLIALQIEDTLTDIGYPPVAHAATCRNAIARLATGGFNAAIVDLNLAGESGWPVADRLYAIGIPFIIASGEVDQDVHRHPQAPRLYKPFGTDELVGALAEIGIAC